MVNSMIITRLKIISDLMIMMIMMTMMMMMMMMVMMMVVMMMMMLFWHTPKMRIHTHAYINSLYIYINKYLEKHHHHHIFIRVRGRRERRKEIVENRKRTQAQTLRYSHWPCCVSYTSNVSLNGCDIVLLQLLAYYGGNLMFDIFYVFSISISIIRNKKKKFKN